MVAWAGGFSGVGFDRAEFRKWLRSQKKPSAYKRIINHNTAAPYIVPSVSPSTRIKNLAHFYKNQRKWSGGPDFFVIGDRVYLGSPLGHSVGSTGWNGNSFHVEVEGDFDGTHDPLTGLGLVAWQTCAWVNAELLDWMGWQLTDKTVTLHREANTDDDPKTRTTHDCPGKLVKKSWVIGLTKVAMEKPTSVPVTVEKPSAPVTEVKPTPVGPKEVTLWVNTPGDTLNLRAEPGGKILQRLAHGLPLKILGGTATWAHVATPASKQGWVAIKYLSPTNPVKVEPKPAPAPVPTPAPTTTPPPVATQGVFPPGSYKYSQFCVDWAKRFEGFRSTAYWDVTGWAIGYGHNGGSGIPPAVNKDSTTTEAEAEVVLMRNLDLQLHYLEAYVNVPLTQGQIDALVLHIFQQGPGNFRRGKVLPLVNAGEHDKAAAEIKNWPTPKAGLIRRRAVEAKIYLGEKPTKW